MTISRDNLDALIEKYEDAALCSDDRAERTLCEEFIDDLKDLRKVL